MSAPLSMIGRFDRARPPARRQASSTLPRELRAVLKCRRFVYLGSSYLATLTAVGVISASTPYLVARVLGRGERDVGTALGATLVVTILTIPAWSALGHRFGDRGVLAGALLAYALLCVGLAGVAHSGSSWMAVLALFAAMGAPFAAAQVLPFTLLAHLVHDEVEDQDGPEGVFTGVWTAAEKVGLALGPSLVGMALAIGGEAAGVIAPLIATVPPALLLIALFLLYLSRPSLEASPPHHAHQ